MLVGASQVTSGALSSSGGAAAPREEVPMWVRYTGAAVVATAGALTSGCVQERERPPFDVVDQGWPPGSTAMLGPVSDWEPLPGGSYGGELGPLEDFVVGTPQTTVLALGDGVHLEMQGMVGEIWTLFSVGFDPGGRREVSTWACWESPGEDMSEEAGVDNDLVLIVDAGVHWLGVRTTLPNGQRLEAVGVVRAVGPE
jgi:hypothetical protein